MSHGGTASHTDIAALPPLVVRALRLARELDFPYSCRIEQGRLLHALASGATGIGETGTGCGVGLAWMASSAPPDARLVSIEHDAERAQATADLFRDDRRVTVIHGNWSELEPHAPFDLLVLDGGGNAKRGEAATPATWLTPRGTVVIDDFTPSAVWPPLTPEGDIDHARLHWLEHPALYATELHLAPDLATIVGTVRTR